MSWLSNTSFSIKDYQHSEGEKVFLILTEVKETKIHYILCVMCEVVG